VQVAVVHYGLRLLRVDRNTVDLALCCTSPCSGTSGANICCWPLCACWFFFPFVRLAFCCFFFACAWSLCLPPPRGCISAQVSRSGLRCTRQLGSLTVRANDELCIVLGTRSVNTRIANERDSHQSTGETARKPRVRRLRLRRLSWPQKASQQSEA